MVSELFLVMMGNTFITALKLIIDRAKLTIEEQLIQKDQVTSIKRIEHTQLLE